MAFEILYFFFSLLQSPEVQKHWIRKHSVRQSFKAQGPQLRREMRSQLTEPPQSQLDKTLNPKDSH